MVFAPLSPVGVGLALTHWPVLFLLSLGSEDRAEGTLFVASFANLKAASLLARDDDFAVPRARFDLANVSPESEHGALRGSSFPEMPNFVAF